MENQENPKTKLVKQTILNRLKVANMQNQSQVSNRSSYNQMQTPQNSFQQMRPLPSIAPKIQGKPIARVDTEQDFRKMPYEGKAKYDNQLKALNALKSQNPQSVQKPKKMFFQHYDTTTPYRPNIESHTNPSGRPPNIPRQMYEGITVKPKRPWVYMGTQNLPPVEYQEANEITARNTQRKNIQENQNYSNQRPGAEGIKARKKGGKKNNMDDSGSEDLHSGYDMSDQMEMSGGDSVFASDLRSQSRLNRRSGRNSEMNDDDMSQGTQTKKRQQNMFNDSQNSDEGYDSSRFQSRSRPSKQLKKQGKSRQSKQQDWSDEE